MTQKHWVFIGSILFLGLAGCLKYPDYGTRDGKLFVYTGYSPEADFSEYTTFYLVDSVALISDSKNDPNRIKDKYALDAIQAYRDNLEARGYVEVSDPDSADLGGMITVLKNISIYSSGYYPGYWWGYPGYYPPGYWGYPSYGYWYPWSAVYYDQSGTVVLELVDLKNAPVEEKLTIVFNAVMGDVYNINNPTQATVDAINQAFEQTPNLKK